MSKVVYSLLVFALGVQVALGGEENGSQSQEQQKMGPIVSLKVRTHNRDIDIINLRTGDGTGVSMGERCSAGNTCSFPYVCTTKDNASYCDYKECIESPCDDGTYCNPNKICAAYLCEGNVDCAGGFECKETGLNNGEGAAYLNACVPDECSRCTSDQICEDKTCVDKPEEEDEESEDPKLDTVNDPAATSYPTEQPGGGCFPSHASVNLKGGSSKKMSELQVGDVVQVSGNKYSPVFMFTHKMATETSSFIQISAVSKDIITLTSEHYLEVNGEMAAALSVRVGDYLTSADGTATEVIEVTEIQSTGLFNPQTVDGSIVVDGVVASTYTTAVEMTTAHTMLSPLRAAYKWIGISLTSLEQGSDFMANLLPNGKAHS